MKFYNTVICYLSVISLFSCFTGLVASQVLQDLKLPESLCQNTQAQEGSEKNGRSMLEPDYQKNLEGFRKNKVAMQQKREEDRVKFLQQQELEKRQAAEQAKKQLAEIGQVHANDIFSQGQKCEAVGLPNDALNCYQTAARLGNAQAATCLENLRCKLVYIAYCAQASYSFAAECEEQGQIDRAMEQYAQAARFGNKQAAARLKELQKSVTSKKIVASQEAENSHKTKS